MAAAANSNRKRLKNSSKFSFNEEDILPPLEKPKSKSMQSRLVRKVSSINNNEIVCRGNESSQSYSKSNMGLGAISSKMGNLKIQTSKPVLPHKEKSNRSQDSAPRSNDDGLLDNIVARLKAEYENSCSGSVVSKEGSVKVVERSSKPSINSVKAVDGIQSAETNLAECICERPMKLVMCILCGFTKPGRVSFQCQFHPRAFFLSDFKECPACKSGGIAKLKEFDLPPGMNEYVK